MIYFFKSHEQKTLVSILEFHELFPDEKSAVEHLEIIRWGNKRVCPHCSVKNKSTARKSKKTKQYRCKECRKEFTIRHGTIFEHSHISLRKWMYTIYILQNADKDISSLQLGKEIGVTQKSAWLMLQRLRMACNSQSLKFSGLTKRND